MVENMHMELVNAYKEEEFFWHQKCRDKWLVFGHRCSIQKPYFQLKDKNDQDQWSDGAKAEVAMNTSQSYLSPLTLGLMIMRLRTSRRNCRMQ